MRIQLKKILCPVDFSPTSARAICYALALAKSFGAEVVLLHVTDIDAVAVCEHYDLPDLDWDLISEMPRPECSVDGGDPDRDGQCTFPPEGDDGKTTELASLRELAEKLRTTHGGVITTRIRDGKPFLEIIAAAREEEVDLIVIGTHGRTGVSHMLIGSTAERVVRLAPCPVLTVKHPEHEFVMP